MADNDYAAFLDRKAQLGTDTGFTPSWMPSSLFDFQASLVEWALLKGRAAIFADCGLGKTLIELVFGENVIRRSNKPVLLLTPLAVSAQTIREADKFGIEAKRSSDGKAHRCITVTNYERLHLFAPDDFAGVIADESSILKNFDGAIKARVTEFMRRVPYRLLATATAAPNDYIELGTSSEALGYLGYTDMLTRFFKNEENSLKPRVYLNKGQDFAGRGSGRSGGSRATLKSRSGDGCVHGRAQFAVRPISVSMTGVSFCRRSPKAST